MKLFNIKIYYIKSPNTPTVVQSKILLTHKKIITINKHKSFLVQSYLL